MDRDPETVEARARELAALLKAIADVASELPRSLGPAGRECQALIFLAERQAEELVDVASQPAAPSVKSAA
jgi:hypothetical protein